MRRAKLILDQMRSTQEIAAWLIKSGVQPDEIKLITIEPLAYQLTQIGRHRPTSDDRITGTKLAIPPTSFLRQATCQRRYSHIAMNTPLHWNLPDHHLPDHWLNIAALVRDEYPLPRDGKTGSDMSHDQLARIYSEECARIEGLEGKYGKDEFISIPGPVMDQLRKYRPAPLVRAAAYEKALGYKGRIFYKTEAGNPSGSHKPNTAIPQVYYAKEQGLRGVVTDTGAGQWGTALAMACQTFGLECNVFMTHGSYVDKPYRRHMMTLAGGKVHSSPSTLTKKGRELLASDPDHAGSLGIGMSEAMEMATESEDVRLCLGCMSYHAALHQTVIGLELVQQLEMAGVTPDALIACVGGGTNFFGFVAPYLKAKLQGSSGGPLLVAAESANAPALTQGEYRYDYADSFRYTPQYKMFTLGHEFIPPRVHAGGLRYHGKSAILSLMAHQGHVHGVAIPQEEAFQAAKEFFLAEGALPAPETAHAIAATARIAKQHTSEDKQTDLVFCFSGTGYLDLIGYAKVFDL